MSCCYICPSRSGCAIKCTFLGNPENEPIRTRIEPEKTAAKNIPKIEEKTQVDQIGKPPVACSLCYVEMSQTKTKLKIDGWEGAPPELAGNGTSRFDELSVLVYLCPKCGKVVFKADSNTK